LRGLNLQTCLILKGIINPVHNDNSSRFCSQDTVA
jgi:hypothetical protein